MPRYLYFQPGRQNLRAFPEGIEEVKATLYAFVESGELEATYRHGDASVVNDGLEALFMYHNRDDRPHARTFFSMSVGCIVVVAQHGLYVCAPLGWEKIEGAKMLFDEQNNVYQLYQFKLGDRVVGITDVGSPENGPELSPVGGIVTRIDGRRVYFLPEGATDEVWNDASILSSDPEIQHAF